MRPTRGPVDSVDAEGFERQTDAICRAIEMPKWLVCGGVLVAVS